MRLNILYLFDLPDQPSRLPYPDQFQPEDWKKHQQILDAVTALGHSIKLLGLYDNIQPLLICLRRYHFDMVFNQLEIFNHNRSNESHITSLLELFNLPYTGSSAFSLSLCRNKFLCKRLLTPHRIKVPKAVLIPQGKSKFSLKQLTYPVFVKPLGLEGSDGIAQSSFAETREACTERVHFLHHHLHADALVEEFIEGRELYASVIGHKQLKVLPLREMIFSDFPAERPKFATFKAKWDDSFRRRWGIANTFARPIPAVIEQKIAHISRTAFRTLNLSGYARLDMRLTSENEIIIIEINPNPALDLEDELAQSAQKAGISYQQLIAAILHVACLRHQHHT